jgi:hypothetical protein
MAAKITHPWRVEQDREHLEEVAQRRGIFVGMGAVDVEEAATIGAKLFDGDLRRGGSLWQRLRFAREGRRHHRRIEVLDYTLADQNERQHDG